MDATTRLQIKELITNVIDSKLEKYTAESDYKPFFEAIFDKETVLIASVVQSLYTTFGMSLYEQIAKILAEAAGYKVETQYDLFGQIDAKTEALINKICSEIETKKRTPDKQSEITLIRSSIQSGAANVDQDKRVDVFLVKPNGEELYVDITTVKPNLKEFKTLRRKMLRWCALRFSQNPNANVKTCIGIPYNPYYPQEYSRWTSSVCDVKNELLVQEKLWEEFAGEDVFSELLEIFKEVGDELKDKILEFMKSQSPEEVQLSLPLDEEEN
ncbi:TdeIII family type II restriction endonuclease [Waterburya agarophytonicola K14]|uniref:type II site-specific deoxyribonuclease n=1 Tax=Waterburya agarophytonicola KI4 TaxID=2874699 RepID=A0A964BTD6_9CYAN|nr:TdeIII family type II restriction endonuclease [Waterburya agarophytonicola KI4]